MARRQNELFIGKKHLTEEGRSIKHPALIKLYATVNVNKLNDKPIKLIGLDIETDPETAELKLIGFWNGESYSHYTEDFLQVLFSMVRMCERNNINIAYWNRLDPFVMFKQFILLFPPEKQKSALARYGKIGGEWNKYTGKWKIKPVIEVEIAGYRFGIKNVIRSSIQFFKYKKGSKFLDTVWSFDIAQLYHFGLEREALGLYDEKTGTYPNARLPYYTKLGEEYHLIDWNRFEYDLDFQKNVLYSNMLDARAVYDLGGIIQEMFHDAFFGHYTNTLVSTGTLARASLLAVFKNKYEGIIPEGTENRQELIDEAVLEDVKSIGFINYYDEWAHMLGGERLKDFYCLTTEAYSGGYIEAIRYGYTKKAYYADIASAYPAIISKLYDLRDSKITYGEGEPPRIKHSYCFIRGTVKVPLGVNFHPVTVKHPINLDTNIRSTGEYIASYTLAERDFLESVGSTFKDETWYNIETTGKLSPMADAVNYFIDLRKRLIAEGNSAEYVAKISANSMYGILFEAVDTYEENLTDEVFRAGYRAGEFFNPIYASIITSETRLLISRNATAIENAGGKVILIMTDAIFWEGTGDMLIEEDVRHIKTLGYFEKPQEVADMVCLGTGRYSYKDIEKGYVASKKRGLNVVDFHAPEGIELDTFNWLNALNIVKKTKMSTIKVKVRALISVGVVAHNSEYTVEDLGKVVVQDREVDLITGRTKRFIDPIIDEDITILCDNLVETRSIYLTKGVLGDGKINDQTLPVLREHIMKLPVITAKSKDLANRSKASKKNAKKNKATLNKEYKAKYNALKKYGYDSKTRNKMKKWSNDQILEQLKKDGKKIWKNENRFKGLNYQNLSNGELLQHAFFYSSSIFRIENSIFTKLEYRFTHI